MSTKFVPLTTRPASTSRHGMTRLRCTRLVSVERRLALGDREALLVERLADDDRDEVDLPQPCERGKILAPADPARVHEAPAHDARDASHLVEVGAFEHPVTVDVGEDERAHAAVLHPGDDLDRRQVARLRPAPGRDEAAARVDAHHRALAELRDDLVEEVDVGERRRTEDDARGARADSIAHGLDRSQPATNLQRDAELAGDALDVVEVLRRAGPRAVEIDDVEVARACLHPCPRRLQGAVGVHGLGVEVALHEAHRPAVGDVDRGIEDHGTAGAVAQRPTKLRSSASPCVEDFSGWHWAPKTLPRSTKEQNVVPYSPTPSTIDSSSGSGTNECTW